MRLIKLALLSTLALAACRGGGDDSGDDTPMPDAPPGGSVKVKDVQNDAMPKGTAVELRGVIVTAVDTFGNRTGDFFVQDSEGGPFSGIKVFGAPLDQVASLQPGDVVDITNAEKDEFQFTGDTGSVTEIKGAAGGMMTVTKKSSGAVPPAAVVDAKAIGAMTVDQRKAEWERWEGVLIKVTGARQLNDIATFGSNPGPDSTQFSITGIAQVQSALVELPAATSMFGVCYESITGVGDHFFNDLLLPRNVADLVVGTGGCNPMATTITETQTGTNVELVQLTDVFVTGLSFNKKSYWVSTAATAAPGEGVFVFVTGTTAPVQPDTVIGKKVSVRGSVTEFNDDTMGGSLTEITFSSPPTVNADPAVALVPVTGVTAAQLTANGAMYESVLVTLTNVAVDTRGNDETNGFIAAGHQGATALKIGTDIVRFVAGDLGCYTSITGFWSNLQAGASVATTKPNSFGFVPKTLGPKAASATACD